jgi:hypothetical protein
MRKNFSFVLLSVLLFAVSVLSATVNFAGGEASSIFCPGDIKVVSLGDNTFNESEDTIATTGAIIFGPYNLAIAKNYPMAGSIRLMAEKSSVASGDSLSFAYQVIGGTSITDTVNSGWTTVDSIKSNTGKVGTYTDISQKTGQAILFRLYNYDADSCAVGAPIRVIMKSSITKQF